MIAVPQICALPTDLNAIGITSSICCFCLYFVGSFIVVIWKSFVMLESNFIITLVERCHPNQNARKALADKFDY
eukprot:3043697-Amphidinium_carterae.2